MIDDLPPARHHRSALQGFSLVELLVVVAIIAILSGVSLVGYNRFQERQGALVAAYQLATDLRDVQQKALSGQKPTGWCNLTTTDQLTSWRLLFNTTTTYQIVGVCSTGTTTIDKTVTLPNSATGPNGTGVDFSALTGATTSSGTISFAVQRIVASGTYSFTVQVNQAGAVTVQ